ncbi:anti-sigma factor family protein [Microvirga sp. 2TAF3]|uniref:anti-sigma factor family protein n=1 Tax=Microvirga sp. 2TAF3 TaxID=3233014 RepID=UPI003F9A5AF4
MGDRPIGEDDLQAYVDGYLAPERRGAVEAYLAANSAVAAQVAAYAQQHKDLRTRLAAKANEPIPARLRIANIMVERRRAPKRLWAASAAAAVWLAVGLALGVSGHAWFSSHNAAMPPDTQRVAQDAITAYRTYVVEKVHPVEVGASQEAHLVQWLSRRLGKPLLAPDLTNQGFHLIGGRLLPAGSSPAALFMYEDGQGNRLTFYARPDGRDEQTAFRFESEGDVSAFSWIDQDLSYVITGRTDREKLLTIAETIHRQVEGRAPIRKDSL